MLGQLHVQQSLDEGSTWTTAWKMSDGQYRDLAEANRSCGGRRGRYLASQALVVVPKDGGHVVLVSNGADGLLRRDVDGKWTRIGWFADDGKQYPPRKLIQGVLPGGNAFFSIAAVALALFLGALGVASIKARAPWRVARWALFFAVSAAAGICGNALVLRWGEAAHPAFVYSVAGWSVAVLGLALKVGVLYRRVLDPGWTTAMLAVVTIVCWLTVVLLHSEGPGKIFNIIGADLAQGFVVVFGIFVCAVTGLTARRYPPEIG
jgi:hypothetical protein